MPLYAGAGALFAQNFFWRKIAAKYLRCDGFTSKLRLLIEILKKRAEFGAKYLRCDVFAMFLRPLLGFFTK